jgi:hypothetical protein
MKTKRRRRTARAKMRAGEAGEATSPTTPTARPSSRSTKACSMPTAASRSRCPRRNRPKHNDQDYRIEARVTDAANREVSGHSTVLATYGSFRVSVEPTAMSSSPATPRVKVTAQDYDGKPIQTQVTRRHDPGEVGFRHPTKHGNPAVTSKRCANRRRRNVLVDLPMGASSGSGDFEVTASAQTPENRTVEGQDLGLDLERRGRVVQRQHAGADRRRQKDLPGGRHRAPAARHRPQ